jgi:RND family efflux transporter MFP subunit
MRPTRLAAALLAAATSLAAGISAAPVHAAKEQQPPTAAALATVIVGAESTPRERLLDGMVEAVYQTTVSAQTAGRVAEINFDVNDVVPRGAVVIRLHSTEQVAGLAQADAALKEAVARESEAQTRYSRIRDMYERRVVAKATLDEATAARDSAVARLTAARAGLEAAREGVAYTEIRAPYAGVVTAKHVQLGETVAPGSPLMSGASLDALRVVVEIPQSIAEEAQRLRQAVVYVDGRRIESTGLTLFPAAEPQTNTFRARVDLPQGVTGLAPGMFVKVGLVTGADERLLVPAAAVVQRSEMRAVYVVAPDGRVSLRQVRLGHVRGDRVEILAGLKNGEAVALDPIAAGLAARRPAGGND